MRRFSFGVLVVGLVLMIAGPAAAGFDNGPQDPPGPVERFQSPFAVDYVDVDDGLVALGGPPPEQGCRGESFEDNVANVQEVRLPNGVIVSLVQDDDMPMRVYAASSIGEICDAVLAGESVEPLASGTVRTVRTDNDLEASATPGGTRTNAFGDHSSGQLSTPAGESCRFSGVFRAQITRDDEFRLLKLDVTLRC